jgi:ribosomal-protein-alanine N-acetyltransferase
MQDTTTYSASMIRKLTAQDAEEVTRLLVANREQHRPFLPLLSDTFFTVDAQRDRLAVSDHVYGILDADALAGTITLSNLLGDPFKSATVGYWVDDARRGRGLATNAVAAIAELAFGELELHRLEAATLVANAASQRVLEKNRFVRIGLAPHYLQIAGVWRDHLLFQRTIED